MKIRWSDSPGTVNAWAMIVALSAAALVWSACSRQTADAPVDAHGEKVVVATTTMIADLAAQIGGPHIRVVSIMKPGTDPHIYDPTPGDSIWFRKADLVLVNGLHLEGKMIEMIEGVGAKAVHLAEDARIRRRQSAAAAAPDPHVWWNVLNFVVFAEQTRDALKRADPAHAGEYDQRASAYIARLREVDEKVRRAIATIPESARYMITSHDAFYYYGEAYGIHVDAVLGISTDAQASADEPARLAGIAHERRIPAIFHETSVSAAQNELVDTIRRLAKEKYGHEMRIAGPLYSDSLDAPETDAGTYIGAVLANTRMIVGALGGQETVLASTATGASS
jgi:manganese/zinc/iron transport system substrate-binding protein